MRNWIVAVSFMSLLCIAPFADADAKTVHTVQKGDTLQKISKRYHVTLPELKAANNLSSSKLAIGDKIVIPDKGKTALRKEVPSQKSSTVAQTSVNAESPVVHVVKRRETLASVAKHYGMSEQELKTANGLKSSRLKPGKQLVVRNTGGAANNRQLYTVKKGDNIWSIARRNNTTVDEIKSLNGLTSNALKPSQKLALSGKAQPRVARAVEQPDRQSEDTQAENLSLPPAQTSAKIAEVKELSKTEDVADMGVKDRLMLFAKKMLSIPYKFGANGVAGVDCSSYVQNVFRIAGIQLPRSAREQYTVGEAVDKNELSAGDLVFFRTYASFPSHVGIYMGNNMFIHASSKNKRVTIDNLNHPYYVSRYIGAKRLLPDGAEVQTEHN
ncbi:MAG TPA: LysM peptidoglycan-binding domain-containing protein [Dissulfurispiraceae bacterium]|nr:LysM peptidoglycan-binding domain-containing protein [Dissulfurispiraceae bacterium]